MLNSVGLGESLLKMIERRQRMDIYMAYGGMVRWVDACTHAHMHAHTHACTQSCNELLHADMRGQLIDAGPACKPGACAAAGSSMPPLAHWSVRAAAGCRQVAGQDLRHVRVAYDSVHSAGPLSYICMLRRGRIVSAA